MKYLFAFILLSLAANLSAQDTKVIFTQLFLANGEVYMAYEVKETDSSYVIREYNLGDIEVNRKKVKSMHPFHSGQMVRIELVDGSIYRGVLESTNLDQVVINTEIAGTVALDRKMMTTIAEVTEKQFVTNPNRTRYFFAPSAIPLDKGEGYYQNAYLLANSANFGITDRFVLGGGIVLPLFFYVTPKYSFKLGEQWHAAVGAIAGTSILPGSFLAGGLPFGVVTYGSAENSITVGSGYGFVYGDGEWEHTSYPIGVVNGMVRLSPRLSLVSENWFIPFEQTVLQEEQIGTDPFGNPIFQYNEVQEANTILALSAGLRILVGDKATFDIAPVYIYPGQEGLVVPYLDFTYRF